MDKTKSNKYIEAIGRRKTAIARVRITPADKASISVNGQSSDSYFKTMELRHIANDAMKAGALTQKFSVTAVIKGSGPHSQAEALRHGLSRALTEYDHDLRGRLKKLGFLKRDPRKVERKKFGLKKARKAPTWSKR